MKLSFITLMVRDWKKSVQFYTELVGLKVMRSFDPGIGQITFLANAEGETMIEVIQPRVPIPCYEGTGMTMSFLCPGQLEALNDVREKAIAMGYVPTEIATGGPEPVNFKVKDPDGVNIEFCQI